MALPLPEHRSGEPSVRGGRLLTRLERPFTLLEAPFARSLPEHLNPIAQAGGLANTCLLIALATGVLLLFWYTPSVGGAHASVERMVQAPFTAGLLRSLHRYSSDMAIAFVVVHAARLFVARRFTGPRWVAWVTGLVLLGLTWLVGWTGYWLVWDEVAREVALATASFLDVVPIFVDPMSRAFLTDGGLNSLLFFVVFFLHVLLPLAMAIAAWLHISRLARSRFLTSKQMTLWLCAVLLLMSVLMPATSAAPARMAITPSGIPLDGWYLLPIVAAERLSAGGAWALLLGLGVVIFSLPWMLARGRMRVAQVNESTCHACMQCVQDCPYSAITMVSRAEPGRTELVARVNEASCVGCGLCGASCEPHAIRLPWDEQLAERRRVDAWFEACAPEQPMMVFACEGAGADALGADGATGRCASLPNARVMVVPCTGWVHSLSVERALRRGARGVIIAGCPPGSCRFREGDALLVDRMFWEREPALRRDKVDASHIRHAHAARIDARFLAREIAAFDAGSPQALSARARGKARGIALAMGLALVASFLTLVAAASRLPHQPRGAGDAQLVVSLRQAGDMVERCRDRSPEELAALPAHMRNPRVCSRGRAPVRVRVAIDGEVMLLKAFPAAGLWSDGQSFAIQNLRIAPGTHHVQVAVARGALHEEELEDESAWTFGESRSLDFTPGHRHVLDIDNGKLKWD